MTKETITRGHLMTELEELNMNNKKLVFGLKLLFNAFCDTDMQTNANEFIALIDDIIEGLEHSAEAYAEYEKMLRSVPFKVEQVGEIGESATAVAV